MTHACPSTLPLILAICAAGCRSAPATDPLPQSSAIRGIKARYFDPTTKQKLEFDVPRSHWVPILSAMRPNRSDPQPADWVVLGDLRITRSDGCPFFVSMYSLRSGEGAFSAGASSDERLYYRGGSTPDLVRALNAAYERFSRSRGSSIGARSESEAVTDGPSVR
jgi:hypothetical protein